MGRAAPSAVAVKTPPKLLRVRPSRRSSPRGLRAVAFESGRLYVSRIVRRPGGVSTAVSTLRVSGPFHKAYTCFLPLKAGLGIRHDLMLATN